MCACVCVYVCVNYVYIAHLNCVSCALCVLEMWVNEECKWINMDILYATTTHGWVWPFGSSRPRARTRLCSNTSVWGSLTHSLPSLARSGSHRSLFACARMRVLGSTTIYTRVRSNTFVYIRFSRISFTQSMAICIIFCVVRCCCCCCCILC